MLEKSRIRYYIPPSSNTVKELFKQTNQKIDDIATENKTKNESINNLAEEERTIAKKIDELKNVVDGKILWNNEEEHRFVKETWKSYFNEKLYEKYDKLISNLDDESVETVAMIVGRVQKMVHNDHIDSDLYTSEEIKKLKELKEKYYPLVIQLTNDVYCYKSYYLPINHFEASVFYYKHGIDLLTNKDYVKDRDILDVGGFIGDSVLVLEELQPRKIYTFEGEPNNYELIKKTIKLNKLTNVIPENVAIGDKKGELTLNLFGSASSCLNVPIYNYSGQVTVPMITVDDYVRDNDIDVALIKVDIEGAEPLFLEGAKKTIIEKRPILLLSIYHNAHDFFELKPMIESWGVKYKYRVYRPTIETATSEILLIAEPE